MNSECRGNDRRKTSGGLVIGAWLFFLLYQHVITVIASRLFWKQSQFSGMPGFWELFEKHTQSILTLLLGAIGLSLLPAIALAITTISHRRCLLLENVRK